MSRRLSWLGLLAMVPAAALGAQTATLTIPAIVERAQGAVVLVRGSSSDGATTYDGTGFLVSADGIVVTNYHVIAHDATAVVKLPNGAYFPVEGVLATDPKRDLALLKLQANGLRTVDLGDSDSVRVGQEVVAIGSPLSLESSVSSGIISGVRDDPALGGSFLQITDPISHGSSGGPLFDLHGRVVGITSMYLEGGENLNFAIPINAVKPLLQRASTHSLPLPGAASAAAAAPVQAADTTSQGCDIGGVSHTPEFCRGAAAGYALASVPARPAGKLSLFVNASVNDDDTVGAEFVYALKDDIADSALYTLASDAKSADFELDVVAVPPDVGTDTAGAIVIECGSGRSLCAQGLVIESFAFDIGSDVIARAAQNWMGQIDQALAALPLQKQ